MKKISSQCPRPDLDYLKWFLSAIKYLKRSGHRFFILRSLQRSFHRCSLKIPRKSLKLPTRTEGKTFAITLLGWRENCCSLVWKSASNHKILLLHGRLPRSTILGYKNKINAMHRCPRGKSRQRAEEKREEVRRKGSERAWKPRNNKIWYENLVKRLSDNL